MTSYPLMTCIYNIIAAMKPTGVACWIMIINTKGIKMGKYPLFDILHNISNILRVPESQMLFELRNPPLYLIYSMLTDY